MSSQPSLRYVFSLVDIVAMCEHYLCCLCHKASNAVQGEVVLPGKVCVHCARLLWDERVRLPNGSWFARGVSFDLSVDDEHDKTKRRKLGSDSEDGTKPSLRAKLAGMNSLNWKFIGFAPYQHYAVKANHYA